MNNLHQTMKLFNDTSLVKYLDYVFGIRPKMSDSVSIKKMNLFSKIIINIILDNNNVLFNVSKIRNCYNFNFLTQIYFMEKNSEVFTMCESDDELYDWKITKETSLLVYDYVNTIKDLSSFEYLPNDIVFEERTYEMHGWIVHNSSKLLERLFVLENDFLIFNEKWNETYTILSEERYREIKNDFVNMDQLKISELFLVAFESEKSIYKDILNDYAYEYKRLAYISKSLN